MLVNDPAEKIHKPRGIIISPYVGATQSRSNIDINTELTLIRSINAHPNNTFASYG